MSDESNKTTSASGRSVAAGAASGVTREQVLADNLPAQESNQPDPVLQLSVGRMGPGAVTLVAIMAAFIIGVVFYGLNSPAPNAQDVGTPKTAAAAPAAGGISPATAPSAPHGTSGHG